MSDDAKLVPANTEVLDKLKKLLRVDPAKGNSAAEVAQALAAAQRLALRHGINLDEVDTEEDITGAGEPFVDEHFRPKNVGNYECLARLPACHTFLSIILRKYFRVKVVMVEDYEKYVSRGVEKMGKTKHLRIHGRKTHVQIAIYVYGYLFQEFMRSWHAHKQKTGALMSSRSSYFAGLFNGLCQKLDVEKGRLEEELQAELPSSQSVALVLVGEKEKLETSFKAAHPRLIYTKVSFGKLDDEEAIHQGTQAGKKIDIKVALR